MKAQAKDIFGWIALIAACALLIGACIVNLQVHAFNRFLLLLLVVPAVMLLMLGWLKRQ